MSASLAHMLLIKVLRQITWLVFYGQDLFTSGRMGMTQKKGNIIKGHYVAAVILLATAILFSQNAFADNDRCVRGDCVTGYGISVEKYATYEGDFKEGQKHGKGFVVFFNGSTFDGSFMNDKRHGQGSFIFADGSRYVGEWVNGRMNGHGTFTFADGEVYVGNWKDGMMHGHGTLLYPDGTKYAGAWYHNDKHGKGMKVLSNGKQKVGYWTFDKYVGRDIQKSVLGRDGAVFTRGELYAHT